MYSVSITDSFSAAHNLRGYEGKCENLHGHNWKIEVVISSEKLDKLGMVIDFKVLKKILGEIFSEIDHQYLNDISYFKEVNPTSENIACFIHSGISKRLTGEQLKVEKVCVWETATSYATYRETR